MQNIEDEDGFTIIETLIALVIISITLLISSQTISIATRSEILASERRGLIAVHRTILAREYKRFRCGDRPKSGALERYEWAIESDGVSIMTDPYQASCFILISIKANKETHRFLHFRSWGAE